jgi:hypothetical protein
MHPRTQHHLAEFVASYVEPGRFVLLVPRGLAQRLVDNSGLIGSAILTANEVSMLPGTEYKQWTFTYKLDERLDGSHIQFEEMGMSMAIPPALRRA